MTLTGDNRSTGRNPVVVPFVHHKSHTDRPKIEPGPVLCEVDKVEV